MSEEVEVGLFEWAKNYKEPEKLQTTSLLQKIFFGSVIIIIFTVIIGMYTRSGKTVKPVTVEPGVTYVDEEGNPVAAKELERGGFVEDTA